MIEKLKILWICGLPRQVQTDVLGGEDYGAHADWSWIMGHLPPPDNIELHIACRVSRSKQSREFDYRGARFHLVPVKSRARALFLFRFDHIYFRDVVERLKPDVVHGWGTEDAYANVAVKLAPIRHVVEVQGNINAYMKRVPMPRLARWAARNEKWILGRARHVAAENEYSLGAARPMVRTSSLFAIEHPIRPDFLTGPPSDGQARQVLFLGAIEDRKGIWDAVEAFRQGAPADWKLCIIGNGSHEAVEKLGNLLASPGLKGRAVHHPRLAPSEIIPLMRSTSVFLLPTRIDTGPTALKEAMAMGLWPVCYENSGPQHYIRTFKFGDLAEDANPVALAAALRRATLEQPWKSPAQTNKIENLIRPHFERQRIWNELREMYQKIAVKQN